MSYFWQNICTPLSTTPPKSYGRNPSRAAYEEQVRGPGKFGGEQPYVPYFYDRSLDGGADEEASYPEGGGWVGIMEVQAEDRRMFPELRGKKKVAFYERSDGIVEEVSWRMARSLMRDMETAYSEDD